MAEIERIEETTGRSSKTQSYSDTAASQLQARQALRSAAPAAASPAGTPTAPADNTPAAVERFTGTNEPLSRGDINQRLSTLATQVTGGAPPMQAQAKEAAKPGSPAPGTPQESVETGATASSGDGLFSSLTGSATGTSGNPRPPAASTAPPVSRPGDPAQRLTAELALKNAAGYDKLPQEMKDRVLNYYSNHPDSDPANPQSLNAFKTLLSDNRLNAGAMGGLERLADPAATPLANGINREELLRQGLSDIASPHTIAQGGKGTCGATAVQSALATRNPERYLSMLGAMASPSGDASSLAGGLRRSPDAPIQDDGSGRSLSVRLMSPSFMNYAVGGIGGGWASYNNDRDRSGMPVGSYGGLRGGQVTGLQEAVLGESASTAGNALLTQGLPNFISRGRRDSSINQMRSALDQGRGVTMAVRWGDGGHFLNVQRMDDQSAYCTNPWGERHKIPLDQIRDRMITASITQGNAVAPVPSATQDWSAYQPLDIPVSSKKKK